MPTLQTTIKEYVLGNHIVEVEIVTDRESELVEAANLTVDGESSSRLVIGKDFQAIKVKDVFVAFNGPPLVVPPDGIPFTTEIGAEAPARMSPTDKESSQPRHTAFQIVMQSARKNGIQYPKIGFFSGTDELRLVCAGDHSTNPGCLYLRDMHGVYCGKVDTRGQFFPPGGGNRGGNLRVIQAFMRLENSSVADIEYMLRAYGKETGECGCCGRILTNEESISLGIGPICRVKYGL